MYNSPYNYNPYLKQPMYQPMEQPIQPVQPLNTQTYIPPQQTKPVTLLGKSVDNLDMVKVQEIPLDGSTSYFPLVDGSAIATKQLLADGTSKITIYKPTIEEENKKEETPKVNYITVDDLNESIKSIDLSGIDSLRDEIDHLRKEIKDLKDMKRGK